MICIPRIAGRTKIISSQHASYPHATVGGLSWVSSAVVQKQEGIFLHLSPITYHRAHFQHYVKYFCDSKLIITASCHLRKYWLQKSQSNLFNGRTLEQLLHKYMYCGHLAVNKPSNCLWYLLYWVQWNIIVYDFHNSFSSLYLKWIAHTFLILSVIGFELIFTVWAHHLCCDGEYMGWAC